MYLRIFLIIFLPHNSLFSQELIPPLNVIHYNATLAPNIQEKAISGKVIIHFEITPEVRSIMLNAGDLQIEKVIGQNAEGFEKNGRELKVYLSERNASRNTIEIVYHGNPRRGLLFNTELDQAYTVYFTSHWLICNDDPSDKATINLNILTEIGKTCVASGEFQGKEEKCEKVLFRWAQSYESPAYTYGFTIGDFIHEREKIGEITLNYYAQNLNTEKLRKVFRETGTILQFFEEKSGIPYPQSSYSQILIGDHYQEMSGFSVLKAAYSDFVLKDSSEIHLTSHELAHQWWGNRITCKSFNHFWLNEGLATYMSTAFSEYKFGKVKYESDIAIYKSIYDGIVKRGKDKPLVFPNWDNPTRDDRNIVYYKGAYVIHLLRLELGDEIFWKGIKSYSQKYHSKSVETEDFQRSMEEVAGKSLEDFFNNWVYLKP